MDWKEIMLNLLTVVKIVYRQKDSAIIHAALIPANLDLELFVTLKTERNPGLSPFLKHQALTFSVITRNYSCRVRPLLGSAATRFPSTPVFRSGRLHPELPDCCTGRLP